MIMVSEERIKTNLILMDSLDYWDELTLKAIDDEETLRYYNLLTTLINTQLENGIKWLKSDEARRYFFNETAYEKEIFEKLESQWDRILSQKYETIEDLLEEVYDYGKAQGYSDMRSRTRYTDTDKLALTHVRNYNFGLIRKLDGELRRAIKNKIFEGVIGGENPRKLAPKLVNLGVEPLPNSTLSPTQRATMIARTEVARAQNTGILQSYVNEGYTQVKILTAEDDNVCYLCLRNAYEFNDDEEIIYANHGDERVHNIKDLINKKNWTPLHPNCRCTYLSIWSSKGEPPKKPYTVNLTDNNVHNWSYQHNGKIFAFQGNTSMGRIDFLYEYGLDISKLDPDEELFLRIFTGNSSAINGYLRNDKKDFDLYAEKWEEINTQLIDDGIISERLQFGDALHIYDSIFEKYSVTLQEDIILCRREDNRYMGRNGKTEYTDKAFTSTSIYEYAKEDEYGDEINYILIPKDTPILYLEGITSSPGDYEVLIKPDIHLDLVENLGPKKKIWELS